MREAAQRRDPDVAKLRVTTQQLEGIRAAWPDLAAIDARLAPESRLDSLVGQAIRKPTAKAGSTTKQERWR